MRIVLLCGPPCSGKSTLAHQLAGPDDVVLDYDDIARALGSPEAWQHAEPYRTLAEEHMQARIHAATQDQCDGTAWVIRSAPWPLMPARLAGALNAHVYLLDPGKAVCLRRADQRPTGTRHAIGSWYYRYQPWAGDRDALELTAVH